MAKYLQNAEEPNENTENISLPAFQDNLTYNDFIQNNDIGE